MTGLLSPAALVLALTGCSGYDTATVKIDTRLRFQTIEAWEATAKAWEFNKDTDRFDGSWLPIRDRILRGLIDEGGITRLRLELRSGAENPVDYWSLFRSGRIGNEQLRSHFYEKINDNADPRTLNDAGVQFSDLDFRVENFVLPAMRIAKKLGRPMDFTLCYVDFAWTDRKGTLSHARNPQEYAELITAAYVHLRRKYGLVPSALEIILEPDNSDGWRGRQIGEAIVAVSRRLTEQGVTTPIIAPSVSVGRRAPDYFDELNRVPGAAERVSVLSYHRYGGILPDRTLQQIAGRAKSAGARTAMLEFTHATVDDLFDDLVGGNVSSWQKYGIAGPARGGGPQPPGNMMIVADAGGQRPRIGILPASAPLAQLFRSVRPGAVRIGATAGRQDVGAVAFRNPGGGIAVSVKADPGLVRRAQEAIWRHLGLRTPALSSGGSHRVRIAGLPPGRYAVERSNADIGTNMRCRMVIGKGAVAVVVLRDGDLATLSERDADATAEMQPCPAEGDGW